MFDPKILARKLANPKLCGLKRLISVKYTLPICKFQEYFLHDLEKYACNSLLNTTEKETMSAFMVGALCG